MITKHILNKLKHTYHYNILKTLNTFTLTDYIIYILRTKDKDVINLIFNELSDYEGINYKNYILTKILTRVYNDMDKVHTNYIPKDYINEINIYNAIDYLNFSFIQSKILPKPSKCSTLIIEKCIPFIVPKSSYIPYSLDLLNTKYINNIYTLATIGLYIYKQELIDPYKFFNKYYINPITKNYIIKNPNTDKHFERNNNETRDNIKI